MISFKKMKEKFVIEFILKFIISLELLQHPLRILNGF
jgi:hypothetical protein